MITLLVAFCMLRSSVVPVEEPRFEIVLARASALPDVRPELVLPNVIAAFDNETNEYPAELLLALAWGESRFEPTVRTGRVCGVLQVVPQHERDCRGLMNGYAAGVDELEELARDRRAHDLVDVLMYRACGVTAFTGGCGKRRWVDAALSRARRLGMRSIRRVS